MRAPAAALLVLVLGGVAACDPKTRTTYELLPATNLQIVPVFAHGDLNATCPSVQAWVVRLDVDDEVGWDLHLLFNGARTRLWGCDGTEECADATIAQPITDLHRVEIEGISATPPEYLGGVAAFHVMCRGVADADVFAGDIDVQTFPTPTPGPTADSYLAAEIDVTVRILAVGASNPLPIDPSGEAPPPLLYGAAASFSDEEHGIGLGVSGPRGTIAIAGGQTEPGTGGSALTVDLPSAIWTFDPRSLTFTNTGHALGTGGAAGLSATPYQGPSGPVILFAGGTGCNDTTCEPVDGYAPLTRTTHLPYGSAPIYGTMPFASTFAAVHLAKQASGPSLIVMLGGVNWNLQQGTYASESWDTFTLFAPEGATVLNWGNEMADGGNAGKFLWSTHVLASPGGDRGSAAVGADVFVAGGMSTSMFGATVLAEGQSFASDKADAPFATTPSLPEARHGVAGVHVPDTQWVYFFGGVGTNGAPVMGATRVSTFTNAIESTNNLLPRTHGKAVALRDKKIGVFAGFRNASGDGQTAVELVSPLAGAFDAALCTPADCPQLLQTRKSPAVVKLQHTHTWLDGAVFLYGGNTTGLASELFVPAYDCAADGVTPVNLELEPIATGTATIPPKCDRGRIYDPADPITDPDGP